ncbi:hypothetical protein LAZ67_1003336 [Cordylochernes scorpioides]|uniref:Cathepsin L n=1 Tax=Cordylochernes scorpioides TaxID=51811 RepID=A0ABY6JWV5_9ARAC|nr:hypothetical protein LAZ67_1003336 [Cordylochernes scorpioides]
MEIPEEMDLPDSLDYRTKGVVTPVKAQGHCGSCWAFSATGAIESQYALETGKLVSLSEQQLVDCALRRNGCKGGDQREAFSYIRYVGGIESEKDYPYKAKCHWFCHFHKNKVAVTIRGFKKMPYADELALQKALVKYGPIAISIQATEHFKTYSNGVLDDPSCVETNGRYRLNHAVLLVGYGTENGKDYWLIKNSWGPEYGDGGYVKMHKFGKSYSPEEEFHRKAIFNENLEEIIKHNLDYDLGLKSYRLGLNKFSDMSFEEFEDKYTGYKKTSKHNFGEPMEIPEEMDLPDSLDYRTKGVVTPVKAQGHCGSCWAFSATGAIEGQYALETGKLISLSEQQLVDCTLRHNGCKGGDQEVAFSYIRRVGGIESEEDYPYEARYHQHCNFRKKKVVVTVKAFRNMPSTDELALQKALVKYGPIAISIQATKHLKYYSSGVLDDTTCKNANSPIALNHAVLLVGYGTENGKDYWLIKNSWGPEYGEDGYVKMVRGQDNRCGVATDALVPIIQI